MSAFYNRLIRASEEIREKFEQVDVEVQVDALAHAIVMSFMFVDKNHPVAARAMDNVRHSHSRAKLDIQPHLYDTWLQCLIDTVAELDPHADEELLQEWHTVMSHAVEHVRSGY